MSESKIPRSIQEIQQAYQQLALRSGHLQYEISEKSKDLALINVEMRDLNFEFITAKSTEEKAKVAAATPVEATPAQPTPEAVS